MTANSIIEKIMLMKKMQSSSTQLPIPPLRKKDSIAPPSANTVVIPTKSATASAVSAPIPIKSESTASATKGKKGKPDPYEQVKAFLESNENPTKKEVMLYFAGKIKNIIENL